MLTRTHPDAAALSAPPWLPTATECGRLIAARDWSGTSLGPIEAWPQSLRTVLAMVLASPVGMVVLWGEDGVMLYNDAYSGFAGGRHPELLGSRVREGWPEVADFNDHVMRVGLGGGTLSYKDQELTLHRHGQPEQVFMNLDYSPLPDDEGRPGGVLAIVIETSESVSAKRSDRDSSERLQLALDAGAIVGTWVWDIANDRFLADERFAAAFDIDPALCRTGLPLTKVMGSIHLDDHARVQKAIAEVLDRGGPYCCDYRVRQRDGSYRWMEANGQVEKDANGTSVRFPGVLIDVHERRAVEAERDQATSILQTFTEAVPGVVYAKDRQGRMLIGNRGTTELIGKPPEDYVGRTDAEFLDDPEQAALVMANDRRIMESGEPAQIIEQVSFPDGSSATWLSSKAPLRNAAGEVIGLVGSSVDVTGRVNAERELAEALQAKEVLLHEVNHRVKNSLQIVTGLLMLQASQAKDSALRQSLLEARGRIAVVAAMHQRLYTTSRHDRVDFGDYVRDLAAETLATLGGDDRVALESSIQPGIMVVLQHAVPLALVVSELVTNAVKYAFPGDRRGKIRLLLQRVDEQIVLEVADDGVGLPDGFDPNKRSGLGMRIVTSLVKQVRGKLDVTTASPGASFRIVINASQID